MSPRLVAVMFLAAGAPALARAGEDASCITSSDCPAPLRCVDEQCRELTAPPRAQSVGSSVMFGNGHDYRTMILVGDVAATATVALFTVLARFAGRGYGIDGGWAVAALFPTTLTGPILHAINGRAAPALISLFGWASVPPTAIGMGAVGELTLGCDCSDDENYGIATFAIAALAGAAIMTGVDVFLARKIDVTSVTWAPAVVPTRGGAVGTLAFVY